MHNIGSLSESLDPSPVEGTRASEGINTYTTLLHGPASETPIVPAAAAARRLLSFPIYLALGAIAKGVDDAIGDAIDGAIDDAIPESSPIKQRQNVRPRIRRTSLSTGAAVSCDTMRKFALGVRWRTDVPFSAGDLHI